VVLDPLKGKATVTEVARPHDLTPSQVEGWIGDGLVAMANGLGARLRDIREQCEQKLKEAHAASGGAQLEINASEKRCRRSAAARPALGNGLDPSVARQGPLVQLGSGTGLCCPREVGGGRLAPRGHAPTAGRP